MPSSNHKEALDELAQIDQRLAELSNEQKNLIERKNSLQAALAENTATPPNTLTSLQKIKIFTARFKGLPDVFAQRWQNTKGRSGYSVACHNEWVKGLLFKKREKGYKTMGYQITENKGLFWEA